MINRRTSRWVTLRVRLTAWYTLSMALTLLFFSGYLYFRFEHSLLAQVDAALQMTASQAIANLDTEDDHLAFQDTEGSQLAVERLSQAGFAVRLLSPDGTLQAGFGRYKEVPWEMPIAAGYRTLGTEDAQWRVYSQPIRLSDKPLDAWLQVAESLEPVRDAVESLEAQILLGLPFVLMLMGVGGYWLADRALHPIDRITRTAQAIGASHLSQRIGYIGPQDEVGRLAITFDQMLDRLQAAFERERRFTADASHELRTPLAVLKGRIGMLLNRPRTVAEYEDALRELEGEVDRLIRLSTDLLFLARLEQRRLPWQPREVDLSELLHMVAEQILPFAEAKGLRLVEKMPPGLYVSADPDYLIRLFLNLLDNAVKYTPPGGQVTIQAGKEGATARVVISDTGAGIPPEHLPHLFERFYRVEGDRSRQSGGAGLGLAIAYEIVRWHRGTIEVQSELGRGTSFTVHLPAQVTKGHSDSRS